jgi:hypothetical protein
MANLLKPSVDQIVFAHSPAAGPARRRPAKTYNVSFLAQDEPAEPISKMVVLRVAGTVAVRIAIFAITGQI